MVRTLLCSLAGAGAGFLVGFAAVSMTLGAQSSRDIVAVMLFVSIFLAGTGAIAGAIIGGVADLREFFTRKDQAPREDRTSESP
jgi:hypothetical protein